MGDHQKTMFEVINSAFEKFDNAKDLAEVAYNTRDINRIVKSGKTAIVLGIEGLDGFNGDPRFL